VSTKKVFDVLSSSDDCGRSVTSWMQRYQSTMLALTTAYMDGHRNGVAQSMLHAYNHDFV
jgi:hypothetical protein